ncbi:hypothetical protein [Hymenobacter chitinivorans]|uniref:DoxX-like protein n=1 Tax=Hymenobacter chitinivorans DSM 11115 TaxID=1121954 RepID=A0A2M9B4P9_9BACT|nr:hypothetical protein [Hymenobacter chitinivorans]PJJ52924.1 hypothetical protein CLV45_3582 [Hymenobacter chitinivorans DSM 11115]
MRVQDLKRAVVLQLAVIYTRYLLGGAFVFASIIKIKGHRFTTLSGELSPINSAMHFFETMYQSGLYWQFIGLGQCVAGLLLLTQRYALLGAVLFLPIISNVFVITVSYSFFGLTPLITGAMLLATVGLLAWDANSLQPLLNRPSVELPTSALYQSKIWEVAGLLLFMSTAGYRAFIDHYDFLLWAGVCTALGGAALLAAWLRYRKQQPAAVPQGF